MDALNLHQPNSTPPTLSPDQVPYELLLGTWHVVASTLPLWRNKRDVTITYTRIEGEEETTFDDLVKFSKRNAKVGSSQWEVKGVDRLERDLEGNGARWKWCVPLVCIVEAMAACPVQALATVDCLIRRARC